jgi:lysophospholipase L1-like esterase
MTGPFAARVLMGFLALLLAACTAGAPTTSEGASAQASASHVQSPEPTEQQPEFLIVALGDSIPYNLADDCPGCIGFVDLYTDALAPQVGGEAGNSNRSRHDGAQTADVLEQLLSDQALLDDLAVADVIVMSLGFNDQPPFADEHPGCPEPISDTDSALDAARLGAATSKACIDNVVPVIRDQMAQVLQLIRAQAPDAPIAMLTAYDTWRGWSALDPVDKSTRTKLYEAETYWLHEWRDAMCAEAEAANATCIDVYSAFNGADGTDPPGDFVSADYTHPSQAGNDRIRDLLVDADLVRTSTYR